MNNITRIASAVGLSFGAVSIANAELVLADLLAGQTIVDEWHDSGSFEGDLVDGLGWFDESYENLHDFVNNSLGSGSPVIPDPASPGGSYTDVFMGSDASAIIPPGAPSSFVIAASTNFSFDLDIDNFTGRHGSAVFGLGTSVNWEDLIYAVQYESSLEGNGTVTGQWSADIYRFGDPMTPVPEPATYGLIGAFALVGLMVQRRVRSRRQGEVKFL